MKDYNHAPVPEETPIEPAASDVTETADVTDPAAVREVFRARHRLAVSVMERPQQYRFAYSLGDIHRLTFLSHEERTAIQNEWHAWHRKYVRLTAVGFTLWLAGAVAAWALWLEADTLSSVLQSTLGLTLSSVWFTVPAVAVTIGLLMGLPAFLATTSAPALSDSYLRGYTDGLTRGVNRALHITPEIEHEMWEELRRAERLDASWRQGEGQSPKPEAEGPSPEA